MASVFDVAAAILEECGEMTTWKLQKLVYYCQAWSTVWDEEELFKEKIEAWANGPVVRELYEEHQRKFRISEVPEGDSNNLTEAEIATVDAVLDYYGNKTGQWLGDLTHMENPWRDARNGVPEGERGNAVISTESLCEYYGSL